MKERKITSQNEYLAHISDPSGGGEDKYNIDRYLQAQGGSTILEIGPGGGKTLEHCKILSDGWHRTDKYYVVDISLSVLENLRKKLKNSNYCTFEFIEADALNLPFPDNTFDIINLSAVAHECSSYAGGIEAIEKLVEECSRVLKNKGILIFRDLEGVNLLEIGEIEFKSIYLQVFFEIFIKRFLDKEICYESKPNFYDKESLSITIEDKVYTLYEYLNLKDQDKFKTDTFIRLRTSCGLIREIQRHFITFLDSYIPEIFYKYSTQIETNNIVLHFSKKSSIDGFKSFCKRKKEDYFKLDEDKFEISNKVFSSFIKYIDSRFFELLFPHKVLVVDSNRAKLEKLLQAHDIKYNKTNSEFLLPLREIIFLQKKLDELEITYEVDKNLMNWFKREADEYYFYCNDIDVLATFISKSQRLEMWHDDLSGYSCLIPIETKFIPRENYISFLQDQCRIVKGYRDYSTLEGKRITHFKKFPIEEGLQKLLGFTIDYDNIRGNESIKTIIKNIHTTIRDYISRSLELNVTLKEFISKESFYEELILLEDDIQQIASSNTIQKVLGRNICLVGGIATKKIPYRIFFQEKGYSIITLTDFLMKEIKNKNPTRKDLFNAGIEIRKKLGDDILAKKAIVEIAEKAYDKFLILGCRLGCEITYIKNAIPGILILGLYPDLDQIMHRLMKRYPEVTENNIRKWIDWNNGKMSDGYTDIPMCLKMCDILLNEKNEDLATD